MNIHLKKLALCAALFFTPALVVLAQDPATPPAPASSSGEQAKPGEKEAGHKGKTFVTVIKEGGIIMWPLIAISIYMLTLIIDSIKRIRPATAAPPDIVNTLRTQFSQGDYQGAFQTCRMKSCFLTNVVRVGLSASSQGKHISEKAMEDAMAKEISNYSTRIYYLNLIGVVTPMIGLTGTVLGMMAAFSTLGTSGIGDPSALAGAIGEVLVATASGLFVAIPGFASYYYFRNRIYAVSSYVEDILNNLFRKMPYEYLAALTIGDEPVYAAIPKEYQQPQTVEEQSA